jgi:hypothetical protein
VRRKPVTPAARTRHAFRNNARRITELENPISGAREETSYGKVRDLPATDNNPLGVSHGLAHGLSFERVTVEELDREWRLTLEELAQAWGAASSTVEQEP